MIIEKIAPNNSIAFVIIWLFILLKNPSPFPEKNLPNTFFVPQTVSLEKIFAKVANILVNTLNTFPILS